MVLAFLRAERRSPLFGAVMPTVDRALLDGPDLKNREENEKRAAALRYRGYRADDGLFRRFPTNVKWQRWAVAMEDLRLFRYARYPTWEQLSGNSRLVGDGAANIDRITVCEAGTSINSAVKAAAAAIDRTESVEEIICVSAKANPAPEDVVVMEGHKRATAYLYARHPPREVTAIIGWSPTMTEWSFF